MRKFRTLAAAAVTLGLLTAAPAAHAAVRYDFNVWSTGEGTPGKAHGWGGYTFVDSRTVNNIDMTIADVCPGDGNSVGMRIQFWAAAGAMPDQVWGGPGVGTGDGCGSQKSSLNQSFIGKDGYAGALYRARVKVCVNEWDVDECSYSAWRDNPYNNDPSRTGG